MKKTILRMMMVVGCAVCSISYAEAQTNVHYRTDIPFDFVVGKKQFTAGTYSIEVKGDGRKFFLLRDARGGNSYAVSTTAGDLNRDSEAALDFQRAGNRHILSAIRVSDLISTLPSVQMDELLAGRAESKKVTLALVKRR